MVLQKTGRDATGVRSFDGGAENRCFGFTPSDQTDLTRLQNCADSHGDRISGYICFTPEIASRISPGQGFERDHPGSRITSRTLVGESGVSSPPDPNNLDVDPTRFGDLGFVARTVLEDFVSFD